MGAALGQLGGRVMEVGQLGQPWVSWGAGWWRWGHGGSTGQG